MAQKGGGGLECFLSRNNAYSPMEIDVINHDDDSRLVIYGTFALACFSKITILIIFLSWEGG